MTKVGQEVDTDASMLDQASGNGKDDIPVELGRFSSVPRPFLRWAGSKQALIQQIRPVIPATYGRYYEPFLGSGALFFYLKPRRATLADVSPELISSWKALRDNCDDIISHLQPLRPNKEYFYNVRANRSKEPAAYAAEFIYLNRTCFNGLYRVNSQGKFNVPYGAPKTDFIFDADNLRACADLLRRRDTTIALKDFEKTVQTARANDLVFFDPPYVTQHNYNGFRDWNETLFRWSDQIRLSNVARRLADRGVHVMISNADHDDVAALYSDFERISLRRTSTLASNMSKRGPTTEALFYTR